MTTTRDTLPRIEQLLEEVRAMVSPPAAEKVEELVRHVMGLYGDGLRRIGRVLAEAGQPADMVADRLIEDDLIANLLIVHGLHPDSVETRVARALDRVRPYLASHGGDVEIVAIDGDAGSLRLRMTGSCDGCPSSILTIKLAVEGAVTELAPEIEQIEVEGVTESHAVTATASSRSEWVELAGSDEPSEATLSVHRIDGARVLVCRVDGRLYAYRDGCPGCGAELEKAPLAGGRLECPGCARRFDIRHAGRAVDSDGAEPLVPVPLLEGVNGARLALGGGPR